VGEQLKEQAKIRAKIRAKKATVLVYIHFTNCQLSALPASAFGFFPEAKSPHSIQVGTGETSLKALLGL